AVDDSRRTARPPAGAWGRRTEAGFGSVCGIARGDGTGRHVRGSHAACGRVITSQSRDRSPVVAAPGAATARRPAGGPPASRPSSGPPWTGVDWSLMYVGLLAYIWIVTTYQ